ncbi:ornithine cyclodeaminase family protein [Neobacillus sp. NPDC058068]|uniref:ornithine cyclodeaminase family protein n=1 Tax=Neobacillus sp. NPDC058068 TaxID=3346325 RepID=UPI0036D797C1
MLVISKREVQELLTIKSCMNVLKTVLADLTMNEAIQELRSVFPIEQGNVLGQMPGYWKREKVVGTKIITVYAENNKNGLPSHQGAVLIFNSSNGKLKAIVDGEKITSIRTAAVSAIATSYLARENSEVLSILGTGEQARSHLEAMLLVRPIKLVKVWGPTKEKAIVFQKEMFQKFKVTIQVCDSVKEAVYDADIICTVTASKVPILMGDWVKEGSHVNAVGACQPKDRELDTDLVEKSKFYVDRLESAINESGDFLIPLNEGVIDQTHMIGEIGELLTKQIEGRKSENCITIFESLGLAIEDLAAANFIYQEAVRLNKGTRISI